MNFEDPRRGCVGVVPLSARLEDWQSELSLRPDVLAELIAEHGSPINLIHTVAMSRNAAELRGAASAHGIDMRIFFARKANKALAFVDEAASIGLGVDLASARELEGALSRGVHPDDLVMTAAVKPPDLLRRCAETRTTVVIDNEDELQQLTALVEPGETTPIALRLAPEPLADAAPSRFGMDLREALALADRRWEAGTDNRIRITGVHFHLHGYDPDARVAAIEESLALIAGLRERGHEPAFLDIGGGVPMSYLDSGEQWGAFWSEHRRAMLGRRPEITYGGHGLGLVASGREIVGTPNVYPFHQELIRGDWLDRILGSPLRERPETTVAAAIIESGLELRCEPGRALLDGCGMTVARVEFRKVRRDGTWLIGLGMNRTQCRSSSEDFMVDPLLIRAEPGAPGNGASGGTGPIDGYLVGAYCMEGELITWRRLEFPEGVSVGDLVAFPNTAGYLMHILESSSHQIPLARNLVLEGESATLDAIDEPVSPAVGP